MLITLLKLGLALLVVLAWASFLTTKTFHVETVIPAPPEEVWKVLVDTQSYPEWNPTFVEVNGQYVVGAKLPSKVKDPTGKILEMTATVKTVIPARELRQAGGLTGIMTYDHRWLLEPVEKWN